MPSVFILAGPNGTGKTTFFEIARQSGFIVQQLPFVNVDIITRSFGDYSEISYEKGQVEYRIQVKALLDARADFMIESNLADSRSYDWIAMMQKNGYEIVLFYLSTEDVAININRVRLRVEEGGHDIPESIIISRYKQSHSYLKTKLSIFKTLHLIDNSTDTALIKMTIKDGKITYEDADIPPWINDVVSVWKRINERQAEY